MPRQEIKNLNCVRVGKGRLLLEIFAGQVVERVQVGIAKSRACRIENSRPETGERMFQRRGEECVVGRAWCGDFAVDTIRQSAAWSLAHQE